MRSPGLNMAVCSIPEKNTAPSWSHQGKLRRDRSSFVQRRGPWRCYSLFHVNPHTCRLFIGCVKFQHNLSLRFSICAASSGKGVASVLRIVATIGVWESDGSPTDLKAATNRPTPYPKD